MDFDLLVNSKISTRSVTLNINSGQMNVPISPSDDSATGVDYCARLDTSNSYPPHTSSRASDDLVFVRDLPRRSPSDCPATGYTSLGGLNFQVYCGRNLFGNDITLWSSSNAPTTLVQNVTNPRWEQTFDQCMEACAVFRPGCFGVAFNLENQMCWFKDDRISTRNITSELTTHSAIANISQFAALNYTCPYQSNSVQGLQNGLEFEILCNQDMSNYGDYIPDNAITDPYHTESLQECMEGFSTSHPLCLAAVWSPDVTGAGYSNCWLKNNQIGTPMPQPFYLTHTALVKLPVFNLSNCREMYSSYTASDGKIFELGCNTGRLQNTNTSFHADNLDTCINTCATNATQNCSGIIFDAVLQAGYENCYLLTTIDDPTSVANSTFAIYNSSAFSPTAPMPQSHSFNRYSWIAGPILGVIILIFLLVAGRLFWRRRRRSSSRLMERTDFPKELISDTVPFIDPGRVNPQNNLAYELPETIRQPDLYIQHNLTSELQGGTTRLI